MRLWVLLVMLAPIGCTPLSKPANQFATAESQALPLCQIVASQGKYDGRRIMVIGELGSTPHQRILWDPACSGEIQIQLSSQADSAAMRQDWEMMEAARPKNGNGIKAIYFGQLVVDQSAPGSFRFKLIDAMLVGTKSN